VATPTPSLSNAQRLPGESLSAWGKRLQAGDRSLAAQAKAKTRSGSTVGSSFNSKHPRGRGGKWRTVGQGASGVEVRTVQRHVGAQADGQYGELTRRQVVAFQRAHGLKVDGVVGTQTVAAMRGNSTASRVKPGALSAADQAFLAGGARGARASGRRMAGSKRSRAMTPAQRLNSGVLVESLNLDVELGDLSLLEAPMKKKPGRVCPKCKTVNAPGAKKCSKCSADISSVRPTMVDAEDMKDGGSDESSEKS
jgi:ribosomal protein L40E